MKTTSDKSEIWIGKKHGAGILDSIKNSKKSVKIVSPYLSASYLEELVKLNKKGVQITLITADKLVEGDNIHSKFKQSDVIKQKKVENKDLKNKKKSMLRTTLIFFVLSLVSFVLSSFVLSLFYFSLILIFIGVFFLFSYSIIKTYSFKYFPLFRIKVFDSHSGKNPSSNELVHSKIFLIDDSILYLGSANFTYSAFNTHYETVIQIKDEKAIEDINKEIENLYNSTDLKSKSIDEWGKEIYEKSVL